jgi:hypothetical protein
MARKVYSWRIAAQDEKVELTIEKIIYEPFSWNG